METVKQFLYLLEVWAVSNENAWALTPLPRRALFVSVLAGKTF